MNESLKVWLQLLGILAMVFVVGLGVSWVSRRAHQPVRGSAPAAAGRPAAG